MTFIVINLELNWPFVHMIWMLDTNPILSNIYVLLIHKKFCIRYIKYTDLCWSMVYIIFYLQKYMTLSPKVSENFFHQNKIEWINNFLTISGYFLPSTTSTHPTIPPSPWRSLSGTHSGRGSGWKPSTVSQGTGRVELALIFNCRDAGAWMWEFWVSYHMFFYMNKGFM